MVAPGLQRTDTRTGHTLSWLVFSVAFMSPKPKSPYQPMEYAPLTSVGSVVALQYEAFATPMNDAGSSTKHRVPASLVSGGGPGLLPAWHPNRRAGKIVARHSLSV